MTYRSLALNVVRAGALAVLCIGACVTARSDHTDDEMQSYNQVICGPRCAHFVLRYYGREEKLSSLVREMQWPDLSQGTSIRQIEDALDSRGIHTRSVQLHNVRRFQPTRPAIVHLHENDDRGDDNMGHFVVVLPESTSRHVAVWDGLSGTRFRPWDDFSREITGAVVLTDDVPIEDVKEAMRLPSGQLAWIGMVATVGLLSLGLFSLTSRRFHLLHR